MLEGLLTRYIESVIYQAVNENMASEQSARMVAMKAASENAATIIDELQLIYNKSAPGGDHQGTVGDRRGCGSGLRPRERSGETNVSNANVTARPDPRGAAAV